MTLQHKTILVTGASQGIGVAVAQVLDHAGANLILVSRHAPPEHLSRHTFISTDLSQKEDIDRLLQQLSTQPIDALLNIAGIGIYKPLESLSTEEVIHSLQLNVFAPFQLIKGLLANLQHSDLSVVLTVGSGAGVVPFAERSAYCTSKFAVRGLMLSLAKEFANRKPSFCLLSLGSTKTTFAGKIIQKQEEDEKNGKAVFSPDFVAQKIVELLESENRPTEVELYPSGYPSK